MTCFREIYEELLDAHNHALRVDVFAVMSASKSWDTSLVLDLSPPLIAGMKLHRRLPQHF